MELGLGNYIRKKRKSLNLSITELASMVSISESTLSKIENNKIRQPKAVYIFRLSKALNVSYELLLELQGFDMEYIKYRDRRDNYR